MQHETVPNFLVPPNSKISIMNIIERKNITDQTTILEKPALPKLHGRPMVSAGDVPD